MSDLLLQDLSAISAMSDVDATDRKTFHRTPLLPPSPNSNSNSTSTALCGVPPLHPTSTKPTDSIPERQLIELLHKASQTIKEERAKTMALQKEMDAMRRERETCQPHVSNPKKRKSPSPRRSGVSPTPNRSPLAPRRTNGGGYSDDRHTKRQSASLQRSSPRDSTHRSSNGTPIISPRPQQQQQQQQLGSGYPYCYPSSLPPSSPKRSWPTPQPTQRPPAHTPKPQTSPKRTKRNPPHPPNPIETSAKSSAEHKPDERDEKERGHWTGPRGFPIPDATSLYNAAMIARLRRSMAPTPSKEQLGEVVHAMVREILRDARRRGWDLQLVRQKPCVYMCTGKMARWAKPGANNERNARVLHLSIDSGRLTVRVGGGNENLLEYLGRHRYFAAS